jgi:hypothetical protein
MNITGSGIGNLIASTFFIIGFIPLICILVFNNIGLYKGWTRGLRIFGYLFSYGFIFALEYLLIYSLKQSAISPLFYFFIYLVILLFLTSIFKSYFQRNSRRSSLTISILTLLVLTAISIKVKPKVVLYNPAFENEFVKALGLKFIAADSLYASHTLCIENDTLAGFYDNVLKHVSEGQARPKCFFVQSINDLHYRKIIDETGSIGSEYYIDYANGAIYTDGTGYGHLAKMIYPDATSAEGYVNSSNSMSLVYKRLIYRNRLIVIAIKGFAVFDTDSEKLLYFSSTRPYPQLIDNKLIYVNWEDKKATVNWFDIDKLKTIQSTEISGGILLGNRLFTDEVSRPPVFNKKALFILTDKGLQVLSLSNYKNLRTIPLPTTKSPWTYHQVDNSKAFLSTNSLLVSLNLADGKTCWKFNGMRLYGLYHDFVIALSSDNATYYIIDKTTGKVIQVVKSSAEERVRVFDKYVIISSGLNGKLYR